jgi:hypothetical protein
MQWGHFNIILEGGTCETLGDYMDTWKMTHFNEFFPREFSMLNVPFQGND